MDAIILLLQSACEINNKFNWYTWYIEQKKKYIYILYINNLKNVVKCSNGGGGWFLISDQILSYN